MPLRTLRNLVVAAAAAATLLAGVLPVPSLPAGPGGTLHAARQAGDGSREDDSGALTEDVVEDGEGEEEESRGVHLFAAGGGERDGLAATGVSPPPGPEGGERIGGAAARVRGPPRRG